MSDFGDAFEGLTEEELAALDQLPAGHHAPPARVEIEIENEGAPQGSTSSSQVPVDPRKLSLM